MKKSNVFPIDPQEFCKQPELMALFVMALNRESPLLHIKNAFLQQINSVRAHDKWLLAPSPK